MRWDMHVIQDTREKQQCSRKISLRAETGSLRLESSVSHDTAKTNKYQFTKTDEEDDEICNLQRRRCLEAKHAHQPARTTCWYFLSVSKCAVFFPPAVFIGEVY